MAAKKKALSLKAIQKMAAAYPGVEEGTSYRTPAWRVRKKLLARMHDKGPWLVLSVADLEEQEALLAAKPKQFLITDHYEGYAMILANLETAKVSDIEPIFAAAWRRSASKAQKAERGEG